MSSNPQNKKKGFFICTKFPFTINFATALKDHNKKQLISFQLSKLEIIQEAQVNQLKKE